MLWCLIWLPMLCSDTETTAVWFVGCNRKPRFCDLFWLLRGSFDLFWLRFLNTNANAPAYWWRAQAQTLQRYTAHLCPVFEFSDVLHMRNLSYQRSPKVYFTCLHQWFCFSPCFCLWNQCMDDLNTDNFQLLFPHILIQKVTQKCVFFSLHGHQKLSWAFHVLVLQFVIWRYR